MGAQSREPGPRESRRRASAQRFGRGSGPSAERRAARRGTAAWDDEPPSAEERVAARLAQRAGAAGGEAGRSGRAGRDGRMDRVSRPAVRKRRWTKGKVAALVLSLLALSLAAAVVVGFSWLRWFSADDGADIQGTWYLAGTSTPITITDERIQLTEDVAYHYALDPVAKTIQFTFGNLTGGGCYRFSLDRDELALVDGSFSATDTLGRDIGWTLEALIEKLRDGDLPPAEEAGRGLTLLSRTPTAGATANPQSVRDTPAPGEGSLGSADGADDDSETDGGAQTIEDEPVGDLSGKVPAAIDEPRDKAADDTGGAGASGSADGAGGTTGGTGDGASAPDGAGTAGAGADDDGAGTSAGRGA